jgi:hypothetical protein
MSIRRKSYYSYENKKECTTKVVLFQFWLYVTVELTAKTREGVLRAFVVKNSLTFRNQNRSSRK